MLQCMYNKIIVGVHAYFFKNFGLTTCCEPIAIIVIFISWIHLHSANQWPWMNMRHWYISSFVATTLYTLSIVHKIEQHKHKLFQNSEWKSNFLNNLVLHGSTCWVYIMDKLPGPTQYLTKYHQQISCCVQIQKLWQPTKTSTIMQNPTPTSRNIGAAQNIKSEFWLPSATTKTWRTEILHVARWYYGICLL